MLRHKCSYCGREWIQPGSIKTVGCLPCVESGNKGATADRAGVLVWPAHPRLET